MANANTMNVTLTDSTPTPTITVKSTVANIIANGTFGGGTLTFYARALNHTSGSFLATISGGVMTAPGALQLNIQPCEVMAILTGSSAGSVELTVG